MIAMHYRLPLPADYDMGIIDRRIADKGRLTDGFPGLLFKAYLSARKGDAAPDNAYAPLYVWRTVEGMHAFLNGPGFAALADAFGRPAVATWLVWEAHLTSGATDARWAGIEREPIAPGTDLAALRTRERARAAAMLAHDGALATVAGYEPGTWTLLRFALWERPPSPATVPAPGGEVAVYAVGHVSTAG